MHTRWGKLSLGKKSKGKGKGGWERGGEAGDKWGWGGGLVRE